ncbi:MAG TPA: hypothetical protein VFB33_01790 [Candidatus Binataceae bacterium]|nr:hypothetical protein [Candidatus Binataceae bacterium]
MLSDKGRAISAYALALVLAAGAAGCAVRQLVSTPPPAQAAAPARPLPFRGRLAQGDPDQLPPDVALSLSATSPVTFMYREELTHDERHDSMLATALAPSTYAGAPLGEYGVTAFASLSITDGEKIIGDYTAKARVWRSYSLYAAPTHRELEEAARVAVRHKIDAQLEADAGRLAQAIAARSAHPAAPSDHSIQ